MNQTKMQYYTALLIQQVFKKAETESNLTNAHALAKYLLEDEVLNSKISEQTLMRYYNAYILNTGPKRIPDKATRNLLATYLGFEDFAAFVKQQENELENLKLDILQLKKQLTTYKTTTCIAALGCILTLWIMWGNKSSKDCMVWKNGQYIQVECSGADYEKPLNPDILQNFKKIVVCKDSIFFKEGKPLIHYVRHNNTIDFFTASGEHPTHPGKYTKPVTQDIINSRVPHCDSLQ